LTSIAKDFALAPFSPRSFRCSNIPSSTAMRQ
jgi:hypothetical protein